MNRSLLDSDILSLLMRRDPKVVAQTRTYLTQFPKLSFSVITYFEIARGLKAKNAPAQLTAFNKFCDANVIVRLSVDAADLAADYYAALHQGGKLIADADILIAATAKTEGFTLITNNTRHFSRIPNLTVENWSA